MTPQSCNCEERLAPAARTRILEDAADRLAGFNRLSWRQVLDGFTGAAGRLHRYRGLHTRMLHDVLCERDCRRSQGECDA